MEREMSSVGRVLLLLWLVLSGIAWSAPTDGITMEIEVEGNAVQAWMRFPHPRLQQFDANNDGHIDEEELKVEEIEKILDSKIVAWADDQKGRLKVVPSRLGAPEWTHTNVGLRWEFETPPKHIMVDYEYFPEDDQNPECKATYDKGGQLSNFVFTRRQPRLEFSTEEKGFQGGEQILYLLGPLFMLVAIVVGTVLTFRASSNSTNGENPDQESR